MKIIHFPKWLRKLLRRRMLIAFLENNLNEDGTVDIPEVLQPYMGGKKKLIPNK